MCWKWYFRMGARVEAAMAAISKALHCGYKRLSFYMLLYSQRSVNGQQNAAGP